MGSISSPFETNMIEHLDYKEISDSMKGTKYMGFMEANRVTFYIIKVAGTDLGNF